MSAATENNNGEGAAPKQEGEPSPRLYVSNLPWKFDEEAVKEIFQKHGAVSEVRIVRDNRSKRSRGYGFVTFATEQQATKALKALNGHPLDEREISIEYAVGHAKTDEELAAERESRPARVRKPRAKKSSSESGEEVAALKLENAALKAEVAELKQQLMAK
jgi:RNA recognition motif-containing protein